MILIPIVAIFITVGALGEFFRAARASSFLSYREKIINQSVPGIASEPVVAQEWEQWLRRNPVYIVRDWAQFLAIFTIDTGALALGLYTIVTSNLSSRNEISYPFGGIVDPTTCGDVNFDVFVTSFQLLNIDLLAPSTLAIVVAALILWMICPLLHVYLLRQARRQFWNVPH